MPCDRGAICGRVIPLREASAVPLRLGRWLGWLEASIDRAPVDPEDQRGLRLVATDGGEDLPNVAVLHFVEREELTGRRGRQLDARALVLHDLRGQIVDIDLVRSRERDRALDAVLELANVAGPVVVDEKLRRAPRDALHEFALSRCRTRDERVREHED